MPVVIGLSTDRARSICSFGEWHARWASCALTQLVPSVPTVWVLGHPMDYRRASLVSGNLASVLVLCRSDTVGSDSDSRASSFCLEWSRIASP